MLLIISEENISIIFIDFIMGDWHGDDQSLMKLFIDTLRIQKRALAIVAWLQLLFTILSCHYPACFKYIHQYICESEWTTFDINEMKDENDPYQQPINGTAPLE